MTDYQLFVAKSRYARWLDDKGRREDWEETVDRFMTNVILPKLSRGPGYQTYESIKSAILNLEVMPSMRAMMSAGPALDRDNTCGYNCSYLPVDDIKSFDEAMFILLCGTGVGFSVEKKYVNKLPEVPERIFGSDDTIVVKDSKEGWAKALRKLVAMLYSGEIPKWDTSRVRPAGAKLKTFGGRASGPKPLEELFSFVVAVFVGAKGRKLTPIECHDIMCKIGEVVVVGGVRRSAMISLSDLEDDKMRYAKSGNWGEKQGYRALANNSVAYETKPDEETFMREWLSLVESKSGERGIFNRQAAISQSSKSGRRNTEVDFGVNPCAEIILRPYQFCNLSEVVVRAKDTLDTLKEKVKIATIIGTIQSTYTHFPYLRSIWKKNTEEERLLGVSLTGIFDNLAMSGGAGFIDGVSEQFCDDECAILSDILKILRQVAIDTNKEWAEKLGINQSVAVSCVKPSGTVSQLVDSASGIHPRWSEYYVRTVRGDNKDPMTMFLKDVGIPNEPAIGKEDSTTVFSFPTKAPEGAITRQRLGTIEHLELWMTYQNYWCEHKPSVTINVRKGEWMEVGAWVYKNFDQISGVSFLPYDDHVYQQAPYQEIGVDAYNKAMETFPTDVDWSLLAGYEAEDKTVSMQSFACSGDSCELVDIGRT